ncbi:sodium:proton antiporter [Pseudomonas sp. F1_0610]|uniref:cation:proton antiporter n=1 Tax=Pseudomonas sp. F1_0610 TaxID=3114284 RepID=UPI0039C47DB4
MGSTALLEVMVVVFSLAIATTLFNKRVLGLPGAIGVPIVSAVAVLALQFLANNLLHNNSIIQINLNGIKEAVQSINFYDFLINGAICFILMASALKFKVSDLKAYWKPIGILATISLVICAFIFTGIMWVFQKFVMQTEVPFLVLLLLGAALGATDPIGIKGVLSSIKAPHHLMVKLEGESLFNDAMCIAVFMTVLGLIGGQSLSIGAVFGDLLSEILIAGLIGFGFGIVGLKMMKGKHEPESLILTTALVAAGSYLLSLYVHASAPIACVVAGLIVGNRWQEILEKKEIDDVNHFWHTIEGIINSFLFTLIGLELFVINLTSKLLIGGAVAFIVLFIARFLANYMSFRFTSVHRNSYNGSLFILSWAGVRGAISLALILAVANLPVLKEYSEILLGYVFFSVLFSGLVCGLGLPQVINAFYHNENEDTKGFKGYYQRFCHKFNRSGVKYHIVDTPLGESVQVYNTEVVSEQIVKETVAGESETTRNDAHVQAQEEYQAVQKEVDRLENPENF